MHTVRHPARLALAGAFTLLAGCAAGGAGTDTSPSRPAFSEAAYRSHIERLSSDEFEGRAPRTEGERKTVEYIEQQTGPLP